MLHLTSAAPSSAWALVPVHPDDAAEAAATLDKAHVTPVESFRSTSTQPLYGGPGTASHSTHKLGGGDAPSTDSGGDADGVPHHRSSLTGGIEAAVTQRLANANKWRRQSMVVVHKAAVADTAFFLLGSDHPLRLLCARVVSHKYFERVVFFFVALSAIQLAIDEPRKRSCDGATVYYTNYDECLAFADSIKYSDVLITAVFVLEFLLRAVSHGFVLSKNAYLRSGWNCLDFVIIVVSVVSLAISGQSSLAALRSLRVLRALRPLRVIQHYPNLRLVVISMLSAIPRVRNVFMVNLFFIFIFAVVGCQVRVLEGRKGGNWAWIGDSSANHRGSLLDEPPPRSSLLVAR